MIFLSVAADSWSSVEIASRNDPPAPRAMSRPGHDHLLSHLGTPGAERYGRIGVSFAVIVLPVPAVSGETRPFSGPQPLRSLIA